MNKVNVAIVGLGFGSEFIPIYQEYPYSNCAAICRRNEQELQRTADEFGIEKRYTDFDALLADPDIDAVHINTPIADHAWMAEAALKAGKHVASTVPMGLTVEECERLVRLERETGKVYMMMETTVYTREYLYVKQLYESGQMGRLQFLRGSHQQNMGLPGWPSYWYGLPPMHYATHAIGPLADLAGKRIQAVRCHGSGRVDEVYIEPYGSPFAVESAHLELADSDVVCEVTRSLFNTIRQYRESFDVYGSKLSFEWKQIADEHPVLFSGYEEAKRVEVPDTDDRLPREIAKFALRNHVVDDQHVSFIQGAGHGGSHPHLIHEFISSIREKRKSRIDAATAANWTIAGILAHESAMKGGLRMELPLL